MKRWFIMYDLSIESFSYWKKADFIGDVTGLSEYRLFIDGNNFKTKKEAEKIVKKIKNIFLSK